MSKKKRVLMAEDNIPLLRVGEFNLAAAGYEVRCAPNGRIAWDWMQREHFDAVITDQQMPEMTGWQLCQKIRATEFCRHIPVIFLTAKAWELDHQSLQNEVCASRVMSKPFSPRELVAAVDELLFSEPPAEGGASPGEANPASPDNPPVFCTTAADGGAT